MKKKELDNLIMFLCNINLSKIAKVYGYDYFDLEGDKMDYKSKKDYFDGKLREAIDNPLRWLSSLDGSSRAKLTKLIK